MMLRDKVLASILEIYTFDLSAASSSSQCFVNQAVDEILEALVMKNEIRFLTQSIVPLLKVESPPRLQALLKAITSRLKALQTEN